MWRACCLILAACGFEHGRLAETRGDANSDASADARPDTPTCMTTPAWWDPAFTARFPVDAGGAPSGYTLRVDASAALAAGTDVRVVVHDGAAREIDRLLESSTVIFKVPASGTVWLYAGAGAGTAKTNPAQVYLFAESFESISVGTNADGPFVPQPPNDWTVVDNAGNHVYHATGAGRHTAAIRNLMIVDAEFSARIRLGAGGGENHDGLAARGNSLAVNTMDGFVVQLQENLQHWRIAEYVNGASPPTELAGVNQAVTELVWFAFRMRLVGNAVTFYRDDVLVTTIAQSGADGQLIGLFAWDCDVDYDDVRVRMAVEPEPVATLGTIERCD